MSVRPWSKPARTLMGGNYFLQGVLGDPLVKRRVNYSFSAGFFFNVRVPMRVQPGNNKITLFPSAVAVGMMVQEGKGTKSVSRYAYAPPTTCVSPSLHMRAHSILHILSLSLG